MTAKTAPSTPAEVICIESFAYDVGSVAKGHRLPANDPIALRFPRLFLPLGEDTPEAVAERRAELFPEV